MDQPIHHQESAGTIRHDLVRQLVRSQQEASRHRTQAMTDTFAIMCRTLLGIAAIMQGTPIAEVMQYVTMPDATAALQPHAAVPPGSGLNTAAAPTAAPVSIARHNAVAANGSNASATQVVSGQSAVVQAFNTMPGQLEVGAAAPGIVRRGSAATINHLY